MILTLTPDMEAALSEEARRKGTTPERVVLELLQQNLVSVKQSPKAEETLRQNILAAIQRGKYVRSTRNNAGLDSDNFANQKQAEKEREERLWKS